MLFWNRTIILSIERKIEEKVQQYAFTGLVDWKKMEAVSSKEFLNKFIPFL